MTKKYFASLVPLLAIAAVALVPVTAQAAAPEYGRCVKVAKGVVGKFGDSGCEKGEVTSNGLYEWFPGVIKNKFTSTEGLSTFETVGKLKVTCKADTDTGEYTVGGNNKTNSETITFTGCESAGVPCTSKGQSSGTIVTNLLTSTLGFINQAKKEVGDDLEGPGGVFAEFECAGVPIRWTGSVIVKLPVSKMLIKVVRRFIATKGHQKPEKFENEPKDTLASSFGGGAPEQLGFTSTDTVTNEEKIEVNEVL